MNQRPVHLFGVNSSRGSLRVEIFSAQPLRSWSRSSARYGQLDAGPFGARSTTWLAAVPSGEDQIHVDEPQRKLAGKSKRLDGAVMVTMLS